MKNETPRFAVEMRAITMAEGEGARTRIPILQLGTWYKGKQKFSLTAADAASVVAGFRRDPKGELVIDLDHAGEAGLAAPAAGWLKEIEDAPDAAGILWGAAEFTARAAEMIRSGEYKYFSPVVVWGEVDRRTGQRISSAQLRSMALTNQPFLNGMPEARLVASGWDQIQAKEKKAMDTVITMTEGGRAKVVCGECEKETSAAVPAAEKPKVICLSDVGRREGRLDFNGIEIPEGTLVAGEVLHAMRVQGELDAAVQAGKVTPAQRAHFEKLALSDLAGFRELVASMKPQVPLAEAGVAGDGSEGGASSQLARVDGALSEIAAKKRAADSTLSYGAAYKLALSERPDLANERARLMRG